MDIMGMMKQAQELQKKVKDAQDELNKIEVTGDAADGLVVVTCNGQGKFKSIKIQPALLDPDDPDSVDKEALEMLEDVITTAVIKANMEAAKVLEEKMKSVTGGIKIPGLF